MKNTISIDAAEEMSARENVLKQIQSNMKDKMITGALHGALSYAIHMKRRDFVDYFRKVLSDVEFRRQLGRREAIILNPLTVFEYYDDDRNADPFPFDYPLERKLIIVELKISEFVGLCLDDMRGTDDLASLTEAFRGV